MTKVLIVDDHPVVRLAVRLLLENNKYVVVAETDNGMEALRLAREHEPDIVILDLNIPKLDGLEVISRLHNLNLSLRVLVLTSQSTCHFASRCMQAGAAGFICKEEALSELINAVKAVLAGYNFFPDQAFNSIRHSDGSNTESELIKSLSDREMVVWQQLARGLNNKQIADALFLSNKTISTYKVRLLQKLRAKSLVDLAEMAKRNAVV